MISLPVVTMFLSMLSLLSALKGARANPTSSLTKAACEMTDNKGQRAREQKEFRTTEKSLHVSVTGHWKNTLSEESQEILQVLLSLTQQKMVEDQEFVI